MTELHSSDGHQITTEPFSNTRRVTEAPYEADALPPREIRADADSPPSDDSPN